MMFSSGDYINYINEKCSDKVFVAKSKKLVKEMEENGAITDKGFVITIDIASRCLDCLTDIEILYNENYVKYLKNKKGLNNKDIQEKVKKQIEKGYRLWKEYCLLNNWNIDNDLKHWVIMSVSSNSTRDIFENEIYNYLNGRITRDDAKLIVEALDNAVNNCKKNK